MPTPRDACIDACNANFNSCTQAAEDWYQAEIARCEAITDPAQKGQCKRNAAQSYSTMLQGCADQHATCVQACQSSYP